LPYKDPEKKRAYQLEYQRKWREKNREKLNEKHREYDRANRAKYREVRANYRATHKEESKVYQEKNKEKIKRNHAEYYQKNREVVIKRTSKYHQEHKEERQKWYAKYYQKIRLEVLAKVDPAMKCAKCGCDDTRFLEVNHIRGGGAKERNSYKKDGHDFGNNMILLIHNGKRGIEDLNLLCRACNSIDHLERQFGKTGLKVVWDKPQILNSITKSLSF
jgi:hypothetical protein